MSAEALNANPTILNISDLPTRRRQGASQGPQDSSPSNQFANFASPVRATPDPFVDGSAVTALDGSASSESDEEDGDMREEIDEQEIFDLISTISDPEHPLSLGSLAVVSLPDIHMSPPPPNSNPSPNSPSSGAASAAAAAGIRTVTVLITPTVTHCSLATVIGLGVRVRLEQALPPRFRVDVRIKEGSHSTAEQVTKQLNDKERVAAALENASLMGVLNKMLETCR